MHCTHHKRPFAYAPDMGARHALHAVLALHASHPPHASHASHAWHASQECLAYAPDEPRADEGVGHSGVATVPTLRTVGAGAALLGGAPTRRTVPVIARTVPTVARTVPTRLARRLADRAHPSTRSGQMAGGRFASVGRIAVAVEINGLIGPGAATQKPLTSVSGTIHGGLALWLVLYLIGALLNS